MKENKIIPFFQNGLWGFKTSKHEVFIDPIFDCVDFFYSGNARAILKENLVLINKNGLPLTKEKYDSIENPKHSHLNRRVWLDEKYGVIDQYGIEIISPIFEDYAHFSEGRYNFSKLNKIFSFDILGNKVFELSNLDSLSSFKCGVSRFKNKNMCGFLNLDGEIVIPPVYENVSDYKEGIAVFRRGGKCGVINLENEIIVNPIYEDIDAFSSGWFSWIFLAHGFLEVTQNSKVGLINKNGEIQLNCDYNQIDVIDANKVVARIKENIYFINLEFKTFTKTPFTQYTICSNSNNLIVKQGNSFGLVNFYGETLLEFKYDQLMETESGYIFFKNGNKNGFFSSEGIKIIESETIEFSEINPYFILSRGKHSSNLFNFNGEIILDNCKNIIFLDGEFATIHKLSTEFPRVSWKNRIGIIDYMRNSYF